MVLPHDHLERPYRPRTPPLEISPEMLALAETALDALRNHAFKHATVEEWANQLAKDFCAITDDR